MSKNRVSRKFRKLAAVRIRNVDRKAAQSVADAKERALVAESRARSSRDQLHACEQRVAEFFARMGGWDIDVSRGPFLSDRDAMRIRVDISKTTMTLALYESDAGLIRVACEGLAREAFRCIVKMLSEKPVPLHVDGFSDAFDPNAYYSGGSIPRRTR